MRSRLDPLKISLSKTLVRLAEGDARVIGAIWEEAVGPILARESMPVALAGGTLTVRATSREWLEALRGERGHILGRLRELAGPGQISSLTFVLP